MSAYGRPVLGAHVAGLAAKMIASLLNDRMPDRLVALQRLAAEGRVPRERVAEVASAWAAICEAGAQYDQWRASVDGSAEVVLAEVPANSVEIDTRSAADLMGVTPNWVCQLARSGVLPGKKVGPVWLVDRGAVELLREIRNGPLR